MVGDGGEGDGGGEEKIKVSIDDFVLHLENTGFQSSRKSISGKVTSTY